MRGTHGFCKSVLKMTLVSPSTLLVSVGHLKTCFTVIGTLCLHSTSRAVGKRFNKWVELSPSERESNALKFKLACNESSRFAALYLRAEVLSFPQNMGWSLMDGISLQLVPCSSFLVFSYVISTSGRMWLWLIVSVRNYLCYSSA